MKFLQTIIFSLCLIGSYSVNAQDVAMLTALIPVDQLLEDIEILKTNLEKIHPGLYRFSSKEILDKKFAELKTGITQPMDASAFYKKIASLNKVIKNGHTMVIPSETFDNYKATEGRLLPLDVYWDKESLFVLRNNSDEEQIEDGMQIDSINGESAKHVFYYLSDQWTRDGENTTFPEGITYRAFRDFYANSIGMPDTYDLVLSDGNGARKNIKLDALKQSVILGNQEQRYGKIYDYWEKGQGDALALEIKGNTAILSVKTCSTSDVRKFGRSVKKLMNQHFDKMQSNNVEHLIIDLRSNGGGAEIISRELIKHLSQEKFVLFKDSYLITKKLPNKKLYKENIFWTNLFASIGIKKGKDDRYRLNGLGRLFYRANPMLKEHKPVKEIFTGKVYTLIDAYSFSAAGEMAAFLDTYTNSVFIGEETGGNATSVVAGEMFTLELPNSKNRVRIPVVQQIVNSKFQTPGRGVIPDFEVKNSIEDLINKRDAVMEYTFDLIRSSY